MLALLTRAEWDDRTALWYALACVFANGTKPYINLLWVVLPFVVRRSEWKVRFSRAVYAVLTAAGALALTFGVEQYGTLLRHNYGAIARHGHGCFRRVRQRVLRRADPAGGPVGNTGAGGPDERCGLPRRGGEWQYIYYSFRCIIFTILN